MKKILVVDDDEALSDMISILLEQENLRVVLAADAETGLDKLLKEKPDLAIVDLRLPRKSGLDLCREMRGMGLDLPVIVLSGIGDETSKAELLELGASDYVVKPFSPRELVARIRAVLRRTSNDWGSVFRFGEVEVDMERRVVKRQGEEIQVTRGEFNLLVYFLKNANRALNRETILKHVWGYEPGATTRTLDAHVVKLRRKLEQNPNSPRHVITIHGVGYRFLTHPVLQTAC